MMKGLVILVLCFMMLPYSNGQYLSSKDSDPEAIALLQKAGQKFEGKNLQLGFTLTISFPGAEGKPVAGTFYQSGKSYHVDAGEYVIFSDGITRWVYLKGPNEVQIYSATATKDALEPQDFIQLHKSTELVFALAGTRGDGTQVIEAKPLKGRFEDFSKFTIHIKGGQLTSVRALAKDGTKQDLVINSAAYPATLDAAKLFSFQPARFPGAHIEDLRLD